MMKQRHWLIAMAVLLLAGCGEKKSENKTAKRDSTALQYAVISVLPHNVQAWTQGLVIYNNKVLEGTGQTSWIAEVNPGSGQHDKKVSLPGQYFGEGITVLNNKIYQLTWQNRVGFIYDAHTYERIKEFPYDERMKEGWGITHDGKHLLVSDGTDKIHFLDTTTLKIDHSITVTDGNSRVKQINELEYINGYIFANVWQTNYILKIDPASGKVVGRLDLSNIGNEIRNADPHADVLNGIAYDPRSKAMLITGKLWPKAYLIRLQ
jgi:glutamine cyclotransferase